MKLPRLIHTALLAVPFFVFLSLSASTLASPMEAADATGEIEDTAEPSTVSADGADEPASAEAAEATGLDIVMDGSSLEAFERSMEEVRKTGGEKDYQSVKAGFEYLLVFDIGARNDPEILASRLDGLTGNEILSRVRYRRK